MAGLQPLLWVLGVLAETTGPSPSNRPMDCAGRAKRRRRFPTHEPGDTSFQSGVALRLPPQSKIAHGWVEGAGMADRVVGMFIFNLPIMAEGMDIGGPSAVCA